MGRKLTAKGSDYMEELTDLITGEKANRDFYESLNPTSMKDLIDILVTRRGLEREAAYLAAKNANASQIKMMEMVLEEQKKKVQKYGAAGDEEDSRFHRLIALSSGNTVLQNAIILLRKKNILTEHLATVRKILGGELYKDHLKILNCIKDKDSSGAVRAMEEHINIIIKEFSSFSSLTKIEFKNVIRDFNEGS
jgi:GntR family transcriptional repressor for pyruvate dehydrogenase complex